jgi:hypothetical protein
MAKVTINGLGRICSGPRSAGSPRAANAAERQAGGGAKGRARNDVGGVVSAGPHAGPGDGGTDDPDRNGQLGCLARDRDGERDRRGRVPGGKRRGDGAR